MKTLILTLIAFAALQSQLYADAELKGQPSELTAFLTALPPTVNVSGEGEVKAQADRAILTFNVSTEARSLHDALQANQAMRYKLASLLKERGIEASRIQTGRFSSTQKHGVFSEKIKSHRVDNMVKVTVHSEQEFQAAAGASDRFSEVTYVGVDFEYSEKEKLKAMAVGQACDNADRRRKAFEEKLGLRLTPRRFIDGPSPVNQVAPPRSYFGAVEARAPSFGSPVESVGPRDNRAESEVAFGELVFRSQVTIEYAVEKK